VLRRHFPEFSMSQASASPSGLTLVSETPDLDPQIETLLDHAFGPGRFTKVSERVREFATFRPDLSFCAFEGDRLVGVVRQYEIRIGDQPAIFLGPLAVMADTRKSGAGGQLVTRACEAAVAAGHPVVLLVGDEPYFSRLGFSSAQTRAVVLPGPVDQRRVLSHGAESPLFGPVQAI